MSGHGTKDRFVASDGRSVKLESIYEKFEETERVDLILMPRVLSDIIEIDVQHSILQYTGQCCVCVCVRIKFYHRFMPRRKTSRINSTEESVRCVQKTEGVVDNDGVQWQKR